MIENYWRILVFERVSGHITIDMAFKLTQLLNLLL